MGSVSVGIALNDNKVGMEMRGSGDDWYWPTCVAVESVLCAQACCVHESAQHFAPAQSKGVGASRMSKRISGRGTASSRSLQQQSVSERRD